MLADKKGFLLAEQTLKIIIALICIGFLAYFLGSLYFSSQKSQEIEQAEASLDLLIVALNSKTTTTELYNPEGWELSAWPYGEDIPLMCLNMGWENCICICEGDSVEECDKVGKGICVESNKVVIEGGQSFIEIDGILNLGLIYQENQIVIVER